MQMLRNLGQNETYILYFLSPFLFKKRFRATAASNYFQVNAFPVGYFFMSAFSLDANKKIKNKTMQQH